MTDQSTLTLRPLEDETRRAAVIDAVSSYDLASSDAWSALDQLSSRTSFEDLDANIDGIFVRSDGKIEVVAVAYVTLAYGGKKDPVSMSDSYPAKILGHFDGKKFFVDNVEVDTTSFYE